MNPVDSSTYAYRTSLLIDRSVYDGDASPILTSRARPPLPRQNLSRHTAIPRDAIQGFLTMSTKKPRNNDKNRYTNSKQT